MKCDICKLDKKIEKSIAVIDEAKNPRELIQTDLIHICIDCILNKKQEIHNRIFK